MSSRHLELYITAESPCSYFDDRMNVNLVPGPDTPLNTPIYNQLIQFGFRRSGKHCYRPHCGDCKECVACRLPVNEFTANRSQRRCFKSNQHLEFTATTARFTEEYFELYSRYLNSRHNDSSMAQPSKEDFEEFLYCDWCDTQFLELRLPKDQGGKLLAVAVTDVVSDGLSAVYSFFDPEMERSGLGTYCILKQIEHAKTLGLHYVYLGYWIENHNKMQYKSKFKPLQIYINEQWKAQDTQQKVE